MQADTIRRLLPWLIKFVVSASLIAYLLDKVGLQGAWSRAQQISPVMVLAAAAVLAGQTVVWALRWAQVIRAMGRHLPVRQSILITFVGLFVNQFLPASLGADIVRMWQSRRAGLPISPAVNSVLLERAVNVLVVSMLAAVTAPYWIGFHGSALAGWAFPALALCALGGIALVACLDRLPRGWHDHRWFRGLAYLAKDTRMVFLNPGHMAGLATLAVLGQFMLATSVYLLASGMGLGLTLLQCLVLMPPVVLISSLPISVAGWGVREFVMITALGFMGVKADAALLLSIVFAMLVMLVSLPGGAVWLLLRAPRAVP